METTTPRHAIAEIRALAARRNAPLLLELDLATDPVEGVVDDPLAAWRGRGRQTLRELVDGLRRAALDPRTRVLVAHVASCGMPLSRAQEIRDAVAEFRAAGKFAIAYADTFGEFGGGTVPYYLACAFDQIWLAPPGDLGLTGVASHTPFLRDALDRLGVTTELGARHEYKNAVNTFVERGFTPAHLEATTRVVESCADEIIAGIAAGRRLPSDRVRTLVDAGPLSARVALGAGLVDRLGYRDEVYAAARGRAGAQDPTVEPVTAAPEPLAASAPASRGRPPLAAVPESAAKPAMPATPAIPVAEGGDAVTDEPSRRSADADPELSTGTLPLEPLPAEPATPRADEGPAAVAATGIPAAAAADRPGDGAEGTASAGDAEIQAGTGDGSPAGGPPQRSPDGASPVPMYLGAYRRSAARRESSPPRRVARSLAAVGSRFGAQRGDTGPAVPAQAETGAGLDPDVAVPPALDPGRAAVALIHGTGPVVLRRGGPGVGGPMLAADAVCAAFRAAAKDPDIAAAVFRVDSPGGSYVASDLVRREVERFRATGRPVVVSMGAVAASGGYFVSLAADTIVANPSTLTGSIGVYGGKQVISGLLDKLGVAIGEVAQGEHALMMSARRPFSAGERAKLEEFLDRVYDDFVGKVASARAMSLERAGELARGRVWTGADAYGHGLVDELGGLERALRLAWAAAGLPGARPGQVRLVPRRSLVDRVRPARSSEDQAAAAQAAFGLGGTHGLGAGWAGAWEALAGYFAGVLTGDHAGGWGPLAGLAASAGLPAVGPLLMPPIGPIG
ncbi:MULTISPECIES: signal peptide peptidase SppA [Pseudofrankia]|uniref:signal peptide peptidase SppA n=1 Tax=Pseudofrankia TaxID=2994363 RepID=UPI000234B9AF|nr:MULTISPECIES: signal peptide peptidase SppA [Pseudofrankia]OHV37823.1 peptidase S49 [Pseudofrankia sp. EUN1h]